MEMWIKPLGFWSQVLLSWTFMAMCATWASWKQATSCHWLAYQRWKEASQQVVQLLLRQNIWKCDLAKQMVWLLINFHRMSVQDWSVRQYTSLIVLQYTIHYFQLLINCLHMDVDSHGKSENVHEAEVTVPKNSLFCLNIMWKKISIIFATNYSSTIHQGLPSCL